MEFPRHWSTSFGLAETAVRVRGYSVIVLSRRISVTTHDTVLCMQAQHEEEGDTEGNLDNDASHPAERKGEMAGKIRKPCSKSTRNTLGRRI